MVDVSQVGFGLVSGERYYKLVVTLPGDDRDGGVIAEEVRHPINISVCVHLLAPDVRYLSVCCPTALQLGGFFEKYFDGALKPQSA